MGLKSWARANREDIGLVLSLFEAVAFIIGPPIVYLAALDQPITWQIQFAILGSALASFRLWIKKSPIAKQLGVHSTSQDLPHMKDEP